MILFSKSRLRRSAALVAAIAALSAFGPSVGPKAAVAVNTRPDVVLVVVDDARWDYFADDLDFATVFPNLSRLVAQRGIRFTAGFTVNSWCCPGRASIQTGTWSHTNGVYTNGGAHGGYGAFRRVMGSTLATWLHGAGYRTALYGKSFNEATTEVPPGWDQYGTFVNANKNEGGAYYDYDFARNGVLSHYGSTAADYSTDMTAALSSSYLAGLSGSSPAFLYWAPFAPHAPATPAPRHVSAFTGLRTPAAPPSLGEADVSDKPAYIRAQPQGSTGAAIFAGHLRDQLRTLASVDEGIGQIMAAQKARGRDAKTLLILVNDNGFSRNEHRWSSKEVPYEESIRVPLVIVPPAGDPAAARVDATHFVSTADIAPTIAAYAGVATPAFVEGVSMRPLVQGAQPVWRNDILVEHLRSGPGDAVPTYCAVRGVRWKYVAYADGFRELYDLRADPFELVNRAADPAYAATAAAQRSRLLTLCSPAPPGLAF